MSRPPDRSEITAVGLSERLARGGSLVLLDVRRPEERAFCAIPVPPTAVDLHVPMDEVPSRIDDIRSAQALGPLVVYCHHGVRSQMVADWLRGQGLSHVINLARGVEAWSLDVDPGVPRY